jgi:hypothetical protein
MAWRPLVNWTRVRHLRFRRQLERQAICDRRIAASVVSAGV